MALFLLFIVIVTFVAAKEPESPKRAKNGFVQRQQIEGGNPKRDCERAVAEGDFRLVGVMDVGLQLPGVGKDHLKLLKIYGVKIVEGTSDVVESPADDSFQRTAIGYAKQYNIHLLQRIRRP